MPDVERPHPAYYGPLEGAMMACREAVDSRGLKIFLVSNPLDFDRVHDQVHHMTETYSMMADGRVWLDSNGEETFVRNMALVANLLAAWLQYKREHPGA